MTAPDRSNCSEEVTICFRTLDELVRNHGPYYGCVAGRVANRIKDGTFELDGCTYQLAVNNSCNHLHGGLKVCDYNDDDVGDAFQSSRGRTDYFILYCEGVRPAGMDCICNRHGQHCGHRVQVPESPWRGGLSGQLTGGADTDMPCMGPDDNTVL